LNHFLHCFQKAAYNYASAFSIDPRTGQIRVNEPLSYNSAAVIILTVKVTDKNAEGEKEQSDTGKNKTIVV
jgi:hypothetical protein